MKAAAKNLRQSAMENTIGMKDIRAFYAVVEEGNISHAAQRLAIAQPALSRQMKRLEEMLGTKLFDRGSRRIRLTEAGRVFSERVEKILMLVDGTIRDIEEIGGGEAGTIHLGTITSSGATLLPKLIAEFHRKHPKITFQIWEAEGSRILELLDNRIIEIGITRTQVDEQIYESLILDHEPFIVMMREDQVVGDKPDEVELIDLANSDLIVPLRWKSLVISKSHDAGFDPKIFCVSDSIVQDILFVRNGLGLAILPTSSQDFLTMGGIICKRLNHPEITTHTVISWKKNRALSKGAEKLLDLLRDAISKGEKI